MAKTPTRARKRVKKQVADGMAHIGPFLADDMQQPSFLH